MDLALTATYFPHCGLTFAILFGCSLLVEEEIRKRLSLAVGEAIHPLLMPGIFAEIERSRHVQVVDTTIDELETKILELDFQSDVDGIPDFEREMRNQDKRSAYLDTIYLRNGLVSWNTQLVKMRDHLDVLQNTIFKPVKLKKVLEHSRDKSADDSSDLYSGSSESDGSLEPEQSATSSDEAVNHNRGRPDNLRHTLRREYLRQVACVKAFHEDSELKNISICRQGIEIDKKQMRRVGRKIKYRLKDISDEYEEKIRECTMRVDGMAMATQWVGNSSTVGPFCRTNLIRPIVKQMLK